MHVPTLQAFVDGNKHVIISNLMSFLLSLGETIAIGQQRRREHKNTKWFVMFIIAILGLVVSIVGIIVSVINH